VARSAPRMMFLRQFTPKGEALNYKVTCKLVQMNSISFTRSSLVVILRGVEMDSEQVLIQCIEPCSEHLSQYSCCAPGIRMLWRQVPQHDWSISMPSCTPLHGFTRSSFYSMGYTKLPLLIYVVLAEALPSFNLTLLSCFLRLSFLLP